MALCICQYSSDYIFKIGIFEINPQKGIFVSFYLGPAPNYAQGLLLALCLGIIPSGAQKIGDHV